MHFLPPSPYRAMAAMAALARFHSPAAMMALGCGRGVLLLRSLAEPARIVDAPTRQTQLASIKDRKILNHVNYHTMRKTAIKNARNFKKIVFTNACCHRFAFCPSSSLNRARRILRNPVPLCASKVEI
jgi:hypothetical protein